MNKLFRGIRRLAAWPVIILLFAGALLTPLMLFAIASHIGDGDGQIGNEWLIHALMLLQFFVAMGLLGLRYGIQRPVMHFILIVLGCLGLEWMLRAHDSFLNLPFDSTYHRIHQDVYGNLRKAPDDSVLWSWGLPVTMNEQGFRGRTIVPRNDTNEIRLAFLGDSYTYGAGLRREERYSDLVPRFLSDTLNQDSFTGFNLGYGGLCTMDQLDTLHKWAPMLDPNVVVLGYVLNDVQCGAEGDSEKKRRFNRRFGPVTRFWKRSFSGIGLNLLGNKLVTGFTGRLTAWYGIPPGEQVLDAHYAPDHPGWKTFRQALIGIRDRCRELNLRVPPVFATLAHYGVIDDRFGPAYAEMNRRWYRQVTQLADSLGFITIDFTDQLVQAYAEGQFSLEEMAVAYPLDGHPSALLNEMYARRISDSISAYWAPKVE